jgi:hypothetical protein
MEELAIEWNMETNEKLKKAKLENGFYNIIDAMPAVCTPLSRAMIARSNVPFRNPVTSSSFERSYSNTSACGTDLRNAASPGGNNSTAGIGA